MASLQAIAAVPSWEDLCRVHEPRVRRLCRMLLSEWDEADDATQEALLRLRKAPLGDVDWDAWVTRVTVNVCRDRRRAGWWRWWRSRGVAISDAEWASSGASPEERAANRQQLRRVWDALECLPTRQREVFVLRQIEGWSTEEVGRALGVQPGSVKRHLFRAVRALRAAIGSES